MKLIINIPDDEYKVLMDAKNGNVTRPIMHIQNGTPLPKGHGRLVDMSEVLIKLMQYYDGNKSIGQCLDEVNTIIEADGGDAE